MKVLFLGSPKFSSIVLQHLLDSGINVVGVVTGIDKPNAKGNKTIASELKSISFKYGIYLYQFDKLKNCIDEIKNIDFELSVTASFGQILPESFLSIAPCINVHPSLLPKYRGATPIQSAIANGERITGVTIMKTVKAVDAGDILLQQSVIIHEDDTYSTLHDKLATIGGELCVKAIRQIEMGTAKFIKQDEDHATFCKLINTQDCKLDFNIEAELVASKVKSLKGFNTAYFFAGGEKYFVHFAKALQCLEDIKAGTIMETRKHLIIKCKSGAVEITRIQIAGSKEMDYLSFYNGHKITASEVDE